MLDKFNISINYFKNYLNKFKFIFIIILLLGINGWIFEQKYSSNSNNDLSTRQILPLVSPLGEKNIVTDDYTIRNEDFDEQTYPIGEENEFFSPIVETKVMAPDSQTKDAIWFYDNFTPEQRLDVRKAIDYAIPRDLIIETVLQGLGSKLASPIEANDGAYNASVEARDFNLTKALDHMESAFGYRYNSSSIIEDEREKYFSMTLLSPTSRADRMVWAAIVNDTLHSIGINTTLVIAGWDVGTPRVFDREIEGTQGFDYLHGGYDAFFIGWTGNVDSDIQEWFYERNFVPNGYNIGYINNTEVEEILDRALGELELVDRLAAFNEFQQWFKDNLPYHIILQFNDLWAKDPDLDGVSFSFDYPNYQNWTHVTEDQVTVMTPADFRDMNPLQANSYYDKLAVGDVFEGLIGRFGDDANTYYGQIAENWTTSPDKLTWTFTLRDGLKWSDGTDLTVDDIVFTYQSYLDPATNCFGATSLAIYLNASSIVKINDTAIQFTLNKFYAYSEPHFTLPILQKAQMEVLTGSEWRTDTATNTQYAPIGSGPYMMDEANTNIGTGYVTLVANPYYTNTRGHEDWNNPDRIETIKVEVYYSVDTAVSALESGAIDIIDYNVDLRPYIDTINGTVWGELVISLGWGHQGFYFNQFSPIWGMNPKDPRTMYPEHDLELSLESPSSFVIDEPGMINSTITNYGWTNETDVELQIWIDETLEITQVYPFILGSSTEIFTYSWTPTELGTFNITAYVVPRVNETNIENNTRSFIATVSDPSKKIGIIYSHNEYMYTGLRTYYESLGYVVDNIGTTITTSMLNNYSYIFVGDGGNDWLESEIIAAETYIQNGGIFIGIGVTSPANGTAELATNHGINFLGYAVGSSGSTTNIDSYHPLLEGVTWIYIPGVYNSLDVTNSAKPILWDTTGSGIYGATVDIGFGRLLVLAGDFSYYLYSYDNEILFFNILKWLYWQPQEHEISVSLSTPSALLPGNTTSINVTVENRGLNNETDVVLQLWINGTLETTQNYPSFLTGTTETLSFTWTPTEVGSYNVTAYLFPVTNETSLENNIDTNTVIVTEPILNFEIGDYIHLLDLYGREWTFNYTGYIDETHVR
ncbi:MAG: ABC transporter substrate-binding protein, partial [Candidatus Kariarchaeaceae archaeon]